MKFVYTQVSLVSWYITFTVLIVHAHRGRLEICQNVGPTLITESFDRSALGGLPSRREFLNLFSAFGSYRQFHKPAAPATADPYQTVSLQRSEISHKRRALHAQPITQFRHVPTVLGFQ